MKFLWAAAVSITLFVGGIVGLNKGPTVTSLRGFDEPLMAIGGNKAADHDQALIAAIEAYKQRKSYEDVSALTGYLTANPQSPWSFSLLANLGKVYRKTGYYSKALDAWEQAWKLGKDDKSPQVQALANQVAADLTSLLSALGRSERLAPLLAEAKGRKFYGASDALLTSASENLWLMKNKPGDSFKCGPYALQSIARMQGDKSKEHYKTVFQSQSSPKGFSLTQVRDLSKQMQMNYQMAKRSAGADLIVPSVAHWKSGHYAALLKKQGDFYLTKDPTFAQQTLVSANALTDETDGYFLVPSGPLPTGWTAVSDTEGNSVWGRGVVQFRITDATTGCDKKNSCGCNPGMAGYSILLMLDSLSISDTPVGYSPPVGPDLHFTITYNQYEASQPSNQNYGNFGACWNCSWLSYINIPTATGASASVNRAGGGRESYDASTWIPATSGPYAGKYGPSLLSQVTLWVTTSGSYELHYPDGSEELFGETDSGVRAFLTAIVDPQGNAITLNYMTDGSYRLQSVSDALGLTTTLTYGLAPGTLDLSNPLTYLVTQITDPYGRSASFTYTPSSTPELASITDVIGITSSFTYSSGSVISQMTTPYGNTTFSSSSGSFNALGTPLVRSLTVTEPDGSEVCAESRLDGSNYPTSLDNWPTVEEPYPTVYGFGDYDAAYVSYRNTYYWDKKAMQVLGNNPESDYTQSYIYHFLHANDGVSESRVLESEKPALENRIYYSYPNQTILPQPAIVEGSNADPAEVMRFDGIGNLRVRQYQHNNAANPAPVTTEIDSIGRQTNYTYDTATGIDLLSVTQSTASGTDTLKTITYNNSLNPPHCPASVTDAAGQTTNYTYNAQGQVLTMTPPLRAGHSEETTTYGYTGNYLTSITGPLSGATTTMTYDTLGGQTLNRIRTRADTESYTLTYSYDYLDRVTQILYPDSTTENFSYLNPTTSAVDLDLHSSTDRLNRATTRTYDSTRHLTSITDSKGQTTQYGWCSCGNMTSLTDPKSNVTYFNFDVESRLTSKVYPGETQPPASPDYTYDVLGRVATFKDKRGDVATYSYNLDNTVSGISYSLVSGTVAPPTMAYSYDPYYPRMTSAGTVSISYVPAGALGAESPRTVSNSLTGGSAALNYSYDEWGRVVGRNIDGANNETMVFDSLGRVTNVLNLLAPTTPGFAYTYFDPTHPTGRLGSVSYPNGQSTTFNYFGNSGDERLQEIKNLTPAATVLSQNEYTYDAMGKIQTWQEQTDNNTPLLWTYSYDTADQLTSAVRTNTAISTPAVRSDSYGYDAAGNPTTFNVSGISRSPNYNALNQLTGSTPSGNRIVGFTGSLNGPATVTVNGATAMVNSSHYFSGTASLTPGSTSTVNVVATDSGGNSRTNLYQTTVPAELSYSPTFDADGNELSNGAGQIYSWDAKNELASITYSGGASTVFTYDALGRRIAIVEKTSSGAVTNKKQLVWDRGGIAEERNASNTVTKRFFGQGEQQSSANYYYAFDHLRSIRELTDNSGNLLSRYSYDPYGHVNIIHTPFNTSTPPTDATKQYAGYYAHQPSGFDLTKYRVYEPNTGRWLSRDPIGERTGINLYCYVNNSPENAIDGDGLNPSVPNQQQGAWQLQLILPTMRHLCETCLCPGKIGKCKLEAQEITDRVKKAWNDNYGFFSRHDQNGGLYCWDWAELFEKAVGSTEIWGHRPREFYGKEVSPHYYQVHFAVEIYIKNPCPNAHPSGGCSVTIDDGFADGCTFHPGNGNSAIPSGYFEANYTGYP